MRRIVVANQKGGVAKTTTSLNLAAELSRMGKSVLLIDMDPQNSATSAIFGNENFEYTIYNVMVDRMDIKDVVKHSESFGFDVVPSDIGLSGAPMRISEQIGREKILFHYTRKLPKYDYVIVDAPPSLGLLTVNALTACEELVVPICPDFFSLKGIKLLEEVIRNVKLGLESEITLLSVVITRYRERIVTAQAKTAIKNYFGKWVSDAVIPENIKLEEAHNAHLPIWKYDKKSKGALAYAKLAKEVVNDKPKGKKKKSVKKQKRRKTKTNR
jgi:chromosome partitioning protein